LVEQLDLGRLTGDELSEERPDPQLVTDSGGGRRPNPERLRDGVQLASFVELSEIVESGETERERRERVGEPGTAVSAA
jgi:hypothetical protein